MSGDMLSEQRKLELPPNVVFRYLYATDNRGIRSVRKKKSAARKKIGLQPYTYYTNMKDFFLENMNTED